MENIPSISVDIIIRRFCNELLQDSTSREIKDTSLLGLIKAFDPKEEFYHIENITLWRIRDWRNAEQKIKEDRALWNEQKRKVEQRRDALEKIIQKLKDETGLDDRNVLQPIAIKLLQKLEEGKNEFFGIEYLPKLEKPHTVMDGRNTYNL